MAEQTKEPLGRFDAGDPLYIVVDDNEKHLSYHKTQEGAEAMLKALAASGATEVRQAELHR